MVEEDDVTAAVCGLANEDMAWKDAGYEFILDVDCTFRGIEVGRSTDEVPSNWVFHVGVSTCGFTYAVLGFGVEADAVF